MAETRQRHRNFNPPFPKHSSYLRPGSSSCGSPFFLESVLEGSSLGGNGGGVALPKATRLPVVDADGFPMWIAAEVVSLSVIVGSARKISFSSNLPWGSSPDLKYPDRRDLGGLGPRIAVARGYIAASETYKARCITPAVVQLRCNGTRSIQHYCDVTLRAPATTKKPTRQ